MSGFIRFTFQDEEDLAGEEYIFTDDQGNDPILVDAPGVYEFTGYPEGTTVVVTRTQVGRPECELTQTYQINCL